MATTVVTTQTDRPQEAGCRDNSTPIGVCGCDKRTDPSCCLKFWCPFWTVLNWDGCGATAVLAFFFEWWSPFFWLRLYVSCCWTPQVWGRTYYREKQTVVVGQPAMVQQPQQPVMYAQPAAVPVAQPAAVPVVDQQQTVVYAGDFDSDSEDDSLLV